MQVSIADIIAMLATASGEYSDVVSFTTYTRCCNNASLNGVWDGAGSVDIATIPADTNKTHGYSIQWSRKLTGTRAQVLLRWLSTSTVQHTAGSCMRLCSTLSSAVW